MKIKYFNGGSTYFNQTTLKPCGIDVTRRAASILQRNIQKPSQKSPKRKQRKNTDQQTDWTTYIIEQTRPPTNTGQGHQTPTNDIKRKSTKKHG